jgi:hypothetical protein
MPRAQSLARFFVLRNPEPTVSLKNLKGRIGFFRNLKAKGDHALKIPVSAEVSSGV